MPDSYSLSLSLIECVEIVYFLSRRRQQPKKLSTQLVLSSEDSSNLKEEIFLKILTSVMKKIE